MKRVAVAATILVALIALFSAGLSTNAAAAIRPSVHLSAGRTRVQSQGGAVTLRARTVDGRTCIWQSTPKLKRFNTTLKCEAAMHRIAHLPATTSATSTRFRFTLKVVNGPLVQSARSAVVQSGFTPPPAPPAPSASLALSPSLLSGIGGTVTLSYSTTGAASCSLTSTPTFGLGTNPAPVNCIGSIDLAVPASQTERSWQFTISATSASGLTATSSQTLTESAAPYGVSLNWSGYVVPSPTSSLLTSATGSWIVPTLDCAVTPNAGESPWVGIGGATLASGASSGNLLQTGITDNCVNGTQQDFGWWEEVPSTPNSAREFSSFPVAPGDLIQAYVYLRTDGAWETAVEDLTTGLTGIMITGDGWGVSTGGPTGVFTSSQGSTTSLSYAGGSTAEWIVEDYSIGAVGGALEPFADYGTITFSNLQTSLSTWNLTSSEAVALIQGGAVISTPSAPSGSGFSVSYTG